MLAGGQAASAAGSPVEINVIAPETGPVAFIGKSIVSTLGALETVVNQTGGVGGQPIKFVFYDDQSNPQQAVQLTSLLMAKKIPAIIGPSFTATCRAIVPLLDRGPVDYCLSPGIAPAKDSYVFSAGPSSKDIALIIYRYARLRGWNRIAAIFTTDATGQDADRNTAEILKQPDFKDVTLVASEHFNPTDLEVDAQMARIKAAAPQAIVAWPSGTAFGTALRGFAQASLDVPVLATAANMSVDQLHGYGGFIPKDLYFAASPTLLSVAANQAMKQMQAQFDTAMHAAGATIDSSSGTTWDTGLIVVSALRKLGPDATSEQVRSYIANLSNFTGVAGMYDFRTTSQRGLTDKDLMIVRWDPAQSFWTQASRLGGEPVR